MLLRRSFFLSLIVLYFAFVLSPIFLMVLGSFGDKWFGTLLPSGFTLKWYVQLFGKSMYVRAMFMSLRVAALTVLLNAAIAVPAV